MTDAVDIRRRGALNQVGTTLEMIKWEHSVFALPFALTGAVLAAQGMPATRQLVWIVVCMVAARTAGMSFNRWADAELDAQNPRTKMRAIPAGHLSKSFVGWFTAVASLVFLGAAAQLNHLTLELSPIALGIVLGYSYAKRFTNLSHIVLGLALGIAPAAAWVGIRGTFDARILVLTGIVICWVGGFDVLYACQDAEHDRRTGLRSLPASVGVPGAFWIARTLHVTMLLLSVWLIFLFALGPIAWAGLGLVGLLLAYEHAIVSPQDISRMNAAFFTMNGFVSIVFFLSFATAVIVRHSAGLHK
jgi:4-hydroxybenzoate polyprenyltransferase